MFNLIPVLLQNNLYVVTGDQVNGGGADENLIGNIFALDNLVFY